MGVESFDDLAAFFDVADFGDTATYYPTGKVSKRINGIFDNPQAEMNATDLMQVTIPQPRFVCRTDDLSAVTEGERIDIRAVRYTIRVVVNDGTGVTTLILERY